MKLLLKRLKTSWPRVTAFFLPLLLFCYFTNGVECGGPEALSPKTWGSCYYLLASLLFKNCFRQSLCMICLVVTAFDTIHQPLIFKTHSLAAKDILLTWFSSFWTILFSISDFSFLSLKIHSFYFACYFFPSVCPCPLLSLIIICVWILPNLCV